MDILQSRNALNAAISRLNNLSIVNGMFLAVGSNVLAYVLYASAVIRLPGAILLWIVGLTTVIWITQGMAKKLPVPYLADLSHIVEEPVRMGCGMAHVYGLGAYAACTFDLYLWLPVWWP